MPGSDDETNKNRDGAEKKKPPKDTAVESIETSKVAEESGNKDFDESMREEREKTEAAIRAGVTTTQIEFNQIGLDPRLRPNETLQSRERIELALNPISAQDMKRLEDGRRRFFEPGLDERSRLVALRDSFDAIAAQRGAANSKELIREGRDLIGLSNFMKIADTLTSIDGGRSTDTQRKATAAGALAESLEEIKRLCQVSPPGQSALNLQNMLGGRQQLNEIIGGLQSTNPAQRDEAIRALVQATSERGRFGPDAEWEQGNQLSRTLNERREGRNGSQSGVELLPPDRFGRPLSLDGQQILIEPKLREQLDAMKAARDESRRAMSLDESNQFLYNFGNGKTSKPETLPERVMSVSQFLLNDARGIINSSMGPRARFPGLLKQEPFSQILQPDFQDLRLPLSGANRLDTALSPFGSRLDGLNSPFDDLRVRTREQPKAPSWLAAGQGVRDLSSATNIVEATAALDRLGQLAHEGDPHAKTALAATLVALTTGAEGIALMRSRTQGQDPVFAPDLSRLKDSDRDLLKSFVTAQLGRDLSTSGFLDLRLSGTPLQSDAAIIRPQADVLPKEAITALAIAYGSGLPSNLTAHDRSSIESLLRSQANTESGAYALWYALSAADAQRNDAMEQMLVSGLTGKRGDYFLDQLIPSAMKGNEDAIRILGKAIGQDGFESHKSERVVEALKLAVRNGQGDSVVRTLLEEHGNFGDNGELLNCLGVLAQDGHISGEHTDTITDLLRKQVASGDAETHSSAVRGFARLSDAWTDSDLRLLSDNVSQTTVLALRDVINSTNPERARQLSHLLEENLRSGAYKDVQQQMAAVTAIGVMADYAPASAAAVIKDAISAQRFASSEIADALTMAGVHSLMRIAGSRGAASDFALDALRQPGFRNTASLKLDQKSVRAELADYVTGRLTRAEMSPEAKAATFNSGFPQSLHSLMREQGVGANNVDALVERARNNFDDRTIRSIMSRVELYNALPTEVRAQIVGSQSPSDINFAPRTEASLTSKHSANGNSMPDRIDMLDVFGQMAGGSLESGPNALLLDPLENRVREFREAVAEQRRAVSSEHRTNEDSIQSSLRSLTEHISTGISTWQHVKSKFGSSALSDFTRIQDDRLHWYNHELTDRKMLDGDLRKLNNNHELFSIAADAGEYRRLRNDGMESEADRLALSMLREHGPSLAATAPEMWKDLGMARAPSGELVLGTADGESIWQRLSRQGLAGSSDAPSLHVGDPDGIAYGIKELSVDLNERKLDTPVRRQLALLAIDTDPKIAQFRESSMNLQRTLPDLEKLLRAGLEGTRGANYVNDVRAKVSTLQQEISRMNTEDGKGGTPLSRARASLQQLRDSYDHLDPDVRRDVRERIAAMEQMIEVFDRNSPSGKNIQLLSEKINSTDFSESGFITWLRGDGIKTIAAVGAAVLAAAAVGSALVTFGATSPLAAAAVTLAVASAATVGGIVGYEASAEILYWAGSGERTGAQILHAARGGLVDGEDGNARSARYGEVFADYGWQFVQGLGISLATMGLGAGLGKGISSVAGKVLSRTATAETQAMARIGARAAQIERAAEKAGGQELKKRWMERFAQSFKSEIGGEFVDEGYEKGVDVALEHFVGDANPTLSVIASALRASKGGLSDIDLHPKRGGVMELQFNPGTNGTELMAKLRDQMISDGMRVEWNGRVDSSMRVITPEGHTIDVVPEGAPARTATATEANAEALAKFSSRSLDAPSSETDLKAVRLAQLEADLDKPGESLSAEQTSARMAEIESLRAEIVADFKNAAVAQLTRATGLSAQDARAIVDELNIQIKPYEATATAAGAFRNSDGSLTINAGGYMPSGVRPLNTFVHEFAHALDAARYSALQAANPSGFVDSLVDDVLSNSFSGKTSIWDKPGAQSTGEMIYTRLKTGEGGLSDADVNFARQMLGDYLRQNQPQGTLPQTPTQEALSAWISERGGKFPDSKQEAALLREMVREISHANIVMSESMLGTAAMNDAAMQKMVQAFSSVQGSDPVVFRHAMRGISDATTALADGNRYDFGSRYENRANRFQAREIIEATQNSLPGLTSELRTLIAGNPQFAALNAKLETLSGSSADKSVRRAGVRQSEFFSSAEGKAELARLKENASTREISERIEANTAARQNALSTQRFLTALDMLPYHRATLDSAADSSSRQRAQQAFDSTLQSLIANAKVEDLPRLAKFLETDGLASADQVRDAFAKAGVQLPAPVEVPQVLSTAAGRWNATLDSLSALDRTSALARFRGLDANSEVATDIERTVSDWKPAAQKFDNLRIVQARAEHAAKQEEAWKALGADAEAQTQYWANFKKEMETTAASISQELSPEILQRAEALQSTLNQGLAASNLPPATIVVASTGSSIAFGAQSPAARYNPETGKIEVSPASLLSASPEKISASIRTEYEKSLAHRFSVESAGNQNLSNAQRDAAARVSDMFAQQASANARVQQLEKRAEMLADNQRLLLSEGGVRTLLGRISAPGADAESILGVAPPPELNNLLARFQNARKRDGSLDSKKWSMESDQEVSRLLFPSVYKASVQARTELQRVSSDGPATAGELAYDRASIDTRFEDAIAATDFSPDYGTQMEQRIGLAMDYSWALPDRASLSAIYDFARKEGVVEVGAGKGLWAGALRKMGLDVAAYDINANNVDNNAYHRGESVSTVEEGGTEKAGEHPNKTLLLSYPTPGDSMATDALKAYTDAGGTKLAFIGERPTPGSELFNTGDKQFHETIDNDWVLTGVVDIPHVPDGTNLNTSKLYLYERRGVSLDLQKESKLPDTPASAAEILDRAAVNGDLPSKHRAVYEKALEDGILKPAQLSAIFSSMGSVNREVVVLPLLSSGKLTETGAATLVSLRNSQLSSISEMGSQRLDSLVELMNSPQITRLDIGNFLSLPELQRSTFESLLFGAKPLPKPEVSAKILRMSHDTAADLEKMIDVLPTQRQAVLDFIGTKGPGEISFAALISSRPHLASDKATAVLNATVRNADIVRNAEQKARADRELSLVADAIRSLDTTDAVRLLNELSSGTITTTEVARFQDAAQKGLIGNSLISMKNVLFSHAQMRSTLSSMLEVDGMFSGQLSLGPSGVDQVLRRSNGIAAAVSSGLTSHAELHSLLTGSPADAVTAEIILGQPRAAAGLTRPTVERLVAASKDGTISASDMESIRLALAEGVLTESALKGLLSQPANVRSNLSHQFSQLWHMRNSTHESHLEHPVDTRTDSFIESENRKFIDQYVSALATNPEGVSILRMGAGRLSEFLTPLIPELEPALSKSTPLLLRDAFDGAPAEVRAFTEALSSGNLSKSIEVAMAEMTSCSNQFTSVRIDFNDLSNPNRISAAIEKMDQIGFARGYDGRGESVQVADLARPVVILPNGKSVDISGPKLTLLDGAPTPQDLKFIELLENDPAIRILRGRVALIAFEERLIHSHQGVGGAQSPLVEDSFKQSEEYTKMQNFYRERSADLQQAMREIDVAARLVESGMSLDDVRELMGSRHLSGEREYFYDWFARAHPDRVLPETAARTSTRPELMKESKLYQPPFESERSTKLRARVEKVPEDLRASFDALMRVAKTDAHYDNIENLLATDPAKMSAELKQFMDPKLIKTMKSNIFGFIKEAARQGSASDIANVAASDLQVIDSEIDRDFETASALLWSETPRGISQALSELDPGSVDDFKHHHLTDYADALSESGIEVTEFLGVGFESVAFRAPDGNVVKITRTEQLRSGEWNEDWGNRPFDAEILGEVETFDVPEGQIAVYKQPFVEMGVVENYPDEWKAFQAELRHAGMDFWDDGFKGDQVGVVKDKRGRARVVLIDYPSVTPGGK